MKEIRNPYIENFCKALIKKKSLNLSEEAYSRMVEDLYNLYENMLGRKMVAAIPEELRSQHLAKYEKGVDRPDYEQIARTFGENIPDAGKIMKETLKEFAEIVSKNIARKA